MKVLCLGVGDTADVLLQYVGTFNSRRERECEGLSLEGRREYEGLRAVPEVPAMVFSMYNYQTLAPVLDAGKVVRVPASTENFERRLLALITPNEEWECEIFRELLELILKYLAKA